MPQEPVPGKCPPLLNNPLDRILRYLASVGMIAEVGDERFAANNLTKTFSIPGNKAGLEIRYSATRCMEIKANINPRN